MPGMNRKGPLGDGPMTGRKMGRCNPGNHTEEDRPKRKRGRNWGAEENRIDESQLDPFEGGRGERQRRRRRLGGR